MEMGRSNLYTWLRVTTQVTDFFRVQIAVISSPLPVYLQSSRDGFSFEALLARGFLIPRHQDLVISRCICTYIDMHAHSYCGKPT